MRRSSRTRGAEQFAALMLCVYALCLLGLVVVLALIFGASNDCFASPTRLNTSAPTALDDNMAVAISCAAQRVAAGSSAADSVLVAALLNDDDDDPRLRYTNANQSAVAAAPVNASDFGIALALSSTGRWLYVGAPGTDGVGAVYAYDTNAASYDEVSALTPLFVINGSQYTTPGARFGQRVATSLAGDVVAVSAPLASASAGEVHVFRVDVPSSSSGTPPSDATKLSTLLPLEPAGIFGIGLAVSCDGATAVVGAPLTNFSRGFVGVYDTASGVIEAQIRPDEFESLPPTSDLRFGWTVQTSGRDGFYVTASAPSVESIVSLQRVSSTSARYVERAALLTNESFTAFARDFATDASASRLVVATASDEYVVYTFDAETDVYVFDEIFGVTAADPPSAQLGRAVAMARNGAQYAASYSSNGSSVAEVRCDTRDGGSSCPAC